MRKTFQATIVRDGAACFIPVPFDPRPVFGKARAPVRVTLNGYKYVEAIEEARKPETPARRIAAAVTSAEARAAKRRR